jgi:hypothetical protein
LVARRAGHKAETITARAKERGRVDKRKAIPPREVLRKIHVLTITQESEILRWLSGRQDVFVVVFK